MRPLVGAEVGATLREERRAPAAGVVRLGEQFLDDRLADLVKTTLPGIAKLRREKLL